MPDLGSLLREHYEQIAPPIDVDGLADHLLTEARLRPDPPPRRGIAIAVAAALMVLVVIGGSVLLFERSRSVEVIDESTTPTSFETEPPPEVIPDSDAPPITGGFQVGLPYTVLDREGDSGGGQSIIVGDDGIPLVAYMTDPLDPEAPSEIRLATCADPTCAEPGTVITIAEVHTPPTPPQDGAPQAVEVQALLPDDGLPMIIWSEWDEAESGGETYLRAYKCADAACSAGTLHDIDDRSTWSMQAAVGPDDLPVIARKVGESIHLTKCTDPGCGGEVDTATVQIPDFGWSFALTVDNFSLPVIAAQLSVEGEERLSLGIARCSDPVCADEPSVADLGVPVQDLSAVAVGADDRPVVLTATESPDLEGRQRIVLVACADAACSGSPAVTTMVEGSPYGDLNPFGSLRQAGDGAVTVLSNANGDLHVVTCTDPSCPGGPMDVVVLPDLGWSQTDLALGLGDAPAIAIHGNTDVGVFSCADATCSSSQVLPLSNVPGPQWATTIVAPGDVQFSGTNPCIEVGADGNPIIGYLGIGEDRGPDDGPVAAPKLVLCENAECTAAKTRQLNDEAAWVAMTVRPDGWPVVVYTDWTENWESEQLIVAWCGDTECSSWTTETIDAAGWMNYAFGIATRPNGSIVTVHQNMDDFYVYVTSCSGTTCEGADPVRVDSLVDANDNEWGTRWYMNSLDVAVLPDGRPVFVAAQSNGELRFVECLDEACSRSQMTRIDSTLGSSTASVAVATDGLPIVAYYDDGSLSVASCNDDACSDRTFTQIGEATAGGTGSVTPGLAFGSDGNPLITYWAPRALMIADCEDPSCVGASVSVFANVRTYDVTTLPDGSPVIVYFAYSPDAPGPGDAEYGWPVDLRLAVCTSGNCVNE